MSTSTTTCMVSKNITITQEAYNYLKKLKGAGKSFSDVILEMKNGKKDIMSFAGCLKNADLDSVERAREEMNRDWEARMRDR